ncbi:MAG: cation:proton antiporter [Leptospiraceae bacterium]|nr:cation:proton antiporter [Leptospiraceae bacterium]MCP5512798.1 cation:proton antiporter [Leptospiraceae bacterium]
MHPAYAFILPLKDPVIVFTIVLAIILLSPIILRQFKLPGIVGLILAGVILGPNMTGILERDASIKLFGTVGIIYIMFTAGLEIDMNEIRENRLKIIGFGLLTFLFPQILGTGIGYSFLNFSLASSILFGSLFASHTLLAFPIVTRYGITKNEAVTIAVGGTIIADVGALLILAISVNANSGNNNLTYWIKFSSYIVLYLIFTFKLLPLLIRWFFKNVESDGITDYIFLLFIVFLSSFIAELAGMEPIIGAFFSGLVLNSFVPKVGLLINRIHFTGSAIFIPFFLISVGMLVDLSILFSGLSFWITMITTILIVIVSKWLPAWIFQKALSFSKDERGIIFGLTLPHAAASLATVLIGYDIQLLNQDVLYSTIIMVLVTSMLGSLISENSGKRIAFKEEIKFVNQEDLKQRILVPIANPETIDRLVDIAIMIRDPQSREPIYPLNVVRDSDQVHSDIALGEKKLKTAVERGSASGIPIQIISRVDVNIPAGILRAIKELNITELVMGWNGKPSTREKILGSVFDQLTKSYHNMIWVYKPEKPLNATKRVVVNIPPNSLYELGFFEIMKSIKQMSSAIGAGMVVCSGKDGIEFLVQNLDTIKPKVKITYREIDTWRDFILSRNWTPDDLMITLSAREDTLSWTTELNQMTRTFARTFKNQSFIIAYPSQKMDSLEEI